MPKETTNSYLITEDDYYVANGLGALFFGLPTYHEVDKFYRNSAPENVIEVAKQYVPLLDDFRWSSRFKSAEQFVQENGKLPSTKSSDKQEARIGIWIRNQRAAWKRGILPEIKQELLNAGVPGWSDDVTVRWEQQLASVREHVFKYGMLPTETKDRSEESLLRQWLNSQKRMHEHNRLPAWKIEALDREVPLWREQPEDRWLESLQRLADFVKKNERLPKSTNEEPEEKQVSQWMRKMRTKLSRGTLEGWQVEALDAAVPDWNRTFDREWQDTLAEAVNYLAERGRLPSTASGETHPALARWVSDQKTALRRGVLKPERQEQLDGMLPGWRESLSDLWQRHLENYVEFYRVNKRYPKSNSEDEFEAQLGEWVVTQRRNLRRGKLQRERIDALDEVMPHWEDEWRRTLAETADFLRNNDRFPASKSAERGEKFIGCWLVRQRSALKSGKLEQGKLALLNQEVPGWRGFK